MSKGNERIDFLDAQIGGESMFGWETKNLRLTTLGQPWRLLYMV